MVWYYQSTLTCGLVFGVHHTGWNAPNNDSLTGWGTSIQIAAAAELGGQYQWTQSGDILGVILPGNDDGATLMSFQATVAVEAQLAYGVGWTWEFYTYSASTGRWGCYSLFGWELVGC